LGNQKLDFDSAQV